MKIICTYCSAAKRKDDGLLPAGRRYRSDRITRLGELADGLSLEFRILSGEFGLIDRDYPLPWYDHLLQPGEVARLGDRVAESLCRAGAREVEYHTAAPELVAQVRPYLAVMERACDCASAVLSAVILEGNPE